MKIFRRILPLFKKNIVFFGNRGLTYNPELQLFTESFATDAARIVRWKAFLKKNQWKEALDFKTFMEVIKERLQPMAERYWGK